jgi:hypothetical protein
MTIRTGTLVIGTEQPIGEGITRPVRASIMVDGISHQAVVKTLTPPQLTAELLCAVLLRKWGLPVPEPIILVGDTLQFASMDMGYPNLKQRLGWNSDFPYEIKQLIEMACSQLVCQFDTMPLAISADEAIGNFDRNLGNILWDGENHCYIDHERALNTTEDPDINKLVAMAIKTNNHTEIQSAAVTQALLFNKDSIDDVEIGEIDIAEQRAYVKSRINNLTSRVLDRFPRLQDLLANL